MTEPIGSVPPRLDESIRTQIVNRMENAVLKGTTYIKRNLQQLDLQKNDS